MSEFSIDGTVHDPTEYIGVRVVIVLMYLAVIVVGSFGNIVVLVAICRGKGFGTTSNIFITNLAICDLYLLLIDAPAKLIILNVSVGSEESSNFITIFCSFTTYITSVVGACALLTMLAISVDRYIAVCKPLSYSETCTVERARVVVLLAWLLSALSFVPMATMTTSKVSLVMVPFDYGAEPPSGSGEYIDVRQVCMYVNSRAPAAAVYYFYVFAVFLAVPSAFVTYAYVKIFLHLRRQPPTSNDADKVMDERKKISRMMLCVLIVFIVSWLPYVIFCIVAAFGGTMATDNVFFAYLLTLWLVFLGSALDPYIYSYYSKSFRSQLKSILCFIRARRQRGEYKVNEPKEINHTQSGFEERGLKNLSRECSSPTLATSENGFEMSNSVPTAQRGTTLRGEDVSEPIPNDMTRAGINPTVDTAQLSSGSAVDEEPESNMTRRVPSRETLV